MGRIGRRRRSEPPLTNGHAAAAPLASIRRRPGELGATYKRSTGAQTINHTRAGGGRGGSAHAGGRGLPRPLKAPAASLVQYGGGGGGGKADGLLRVHHAAGGGGETLLA